MSADSVLVIGASGTVGRRVAEGLLRRGWWVRGASRTPGEARRRGLAASEWVHMDLTCPETFVSALSGVERVFMMARPGDPDPARVAAPLIEAMRSTDVGRVVNLTAMGAESRGDIGLGEVESLVQDAGFDWTHLRPNWFMQIFSGGPLLEGIRTSGRLAIPAGDARISFVDARDVAAVATTALVEPGHEGAAYTLTGPDALDHADVAQILTTVSARGVEYLPLGEKEARAQLLEAGFGPDRAERLIRFYRLVRAGHAAPVSRDVETVLRRPPISFEGFARDHAAVWRSSRARRAIVAGGRPASRDEERMRAHEHFRGKEDG